MANPPIQPLQGQNGRKMSYFERLVRSASTYLSKDGINLSFAGYTKTITDYANLRESDITKAWELAKELNAWSEYFTSIANLVQKEYLDAETDKIEIQAVSSIEADSTKVANGERMSNKDPNVVNARKKRNCLKAFYDDLEAKVRFLERAYYHCKQTCEFANKPASGA